MGIRRKIAIGLLGVGTLIGFGTGLASMRHHHDHHRDEMARRLASVCVESALEARGDIDGSARVSARDGDSCDRGERFEAVARRLCAEEGLRRRERSER